MIHIWQVPHITLAHFESADAAKTAGDALAWAPIEFDVASVQLLARDGAEAQFEIVETVCAPRGIKARVTFRAPRRRSDVSSPSSSQ